MDPSPYQHVEQAVNAYDPMRLLAFCAPHDEYKPEVLQITELINRHGKTFPEGISLETLTLIVKFVFEIWFSEGCISQKVAESIAMKILNPSIIVEQHNTVTWLLDQA